MHHETQFCQSVRTGRMDLYDLSAVKVETPSVAPHGQENLRRHRGNYSVPKGNIGLFVETSYFHPEESYRLGFSVSVRFNLSNPQI
jgi:hypothetical protein